MVKYLLLGIVLVILLLALQTHCWVNENRRIEQEIMRNYDRRHRPVKKESTIVRVQMFLTVNHIERVDEAEGTMQLHGILWASWYDENLRWTPSEHNNTSVISMEAWKIWQPTFALYNSAKSNQWFIFMNGVPATVSNDGRVFAAGTFSFQVTCQFDFSDFPYDVQECPIVLADWIYDLSKVNLSEAVSSRSGMSLTKPALRLSFDPLSEEPKKHVAGWEVIDTWQRLCYWGPNGYCVDQNPIGPLDNYWSLIEFGVRIKRHAPYYGLTLVLPILVTISITLLIFWLDNWTLAIFLCVFTLLLESYSGLNLTVQMPPGDGVVPTIGVVHLWNLSLTLVALAVHCIFHFLLSVLPAETKFLPEQLTKMTSTLRQYKFFQTEGISFDPQTIMGFTPLGNHVGYAGFEEEEDLLTTNPPAPMVPDSLIIEMDPIDGPPVPSTSSQFQAIQLESAETPTGPISSQTVGPKKSLFGSVFGSRTEKLNGPVIRTPFGGIFGTDPRENVGEQGGGGTGAEMEDDTQLLIQVEDQQQQKSEDGAKTEEGGEEGDKDKQGEAVENGKELPPVDAKKSAKKSPLEKELLALRRLLFALFVPISLVLIIIVLF